MTWDILYPLPGQYVPAIDVLSLQPQAGSCTLTSDLWTSTAPFDGVGFVTCTLTSPKAVTFDVLEGAMIQKALVW